MGLVSCIEAIVEPSQNCQNDGAVLADGELSGVRLVFLEGDSMSLSRAN